ncbi:putative bifunctional diguanylate cyclase/phosphodiesterase [Marinicella rhabdoformis]|uniref:putative bifunctional diguanylate cyclase/phosphodiesterase n=1 Tax=Marinicella rhabdoformis TaxID=2580566 RepID=UPI0012AEBE56|nr:bifunctional diguanylate cyclase/phosphodiesterase [Marinicella rhabdoformis]
MVNRWEVQNGLSETVWRSDAKNNIDDIKGLDTLVFINADHSVRWLEKNQDTVFSEGMNLTDFQDIYDRLNQAEASQKLELSKPVKNAFGDYVVYLVQSIYEKKTLTGFLMARIKTYEFFESVIINPISSGYWTHIESDGLIIYTNDPVDSLGTYHKVFSINIDSDPEGINFTIYPTEETLAAYLVWLPETIGFSGLIFSCLFYWAMSSRRKSKLKAEELATEIKQKQFIQKKLEHMAHFDTLTNLPNRYLMSLQLDKRISKGESVWLLYLDLDLFKDVNDTLGHGAGDQLLIELSRRLEKILNKAFVARMGGDEFIILLSGKDNQDIVVAKIKTMLQAISRPFYFDEELVRINASIGVAKFPEQSDTASELITHADTALRYVKGQGRNNYKFYDVDLAKSSQDRLLLLNKIKSGIKKKEFELVYQLRVDAKTGKYWGAEALIRWSQKDGSLLTPKIFLEILEESGLIVNVGWQVLDAALDKFKQLLDYNAELKLSYNVSAKQLESPNFVEDLLTVLEEKQFPKSHFEIELTEQTLISDLNHSKHILNQVKSNGITIAIDDFGTGYSSLSYLKNFPVDVIKIDKSFVKDIAIQKDDYELINAIISMGKNLKVKVVAEGIESQDQLNILKRLGCDEVQGYYFNKPAPFEVFKEIIGSEC